MTHEQTPDMDEKQEFPRVRLRRGGWFVEYDPHGRTGSSGPWLSEECAKLALEGKYTEARAIERGIRYGVPEK